MKKAAIRSEAINAHGEAWRLLALPARTPEQDRAMIAAAERSLAAWRQVGTGVHEQRGLWLVARACVAAGQAEQALAFAHATLDATRRHKDMLEDFDLAFAEEIAARAFALAGELASARTHHDAAAALGSVIADENDRAEFFRQFAAEPWSGFRP